MGSKADPCLLPPFAALCRPLLSTGMLSKYRGSSTDDAYYTASVLLVIFYNPSTLPRHTITWITTAWVKMWAFFVASPRSVTHTISSSHMRMRAENRKTKEVTKK